MSLLLVASVAGALSACAPGPAHVSVETLREVADRFDRAQLAQDRATLERMTAPDLILIGGDGTRQNRQQFIDGYFGPGLSFEPATAADRYFIPLGPDVGIVGGEVVMRGTSNGTPFASRIRFSDTFRRIDGEWVAVHLQATRVPAAQ
ncbi:nuclear transport factor 2 family protein [Sphingosinicella sp.]|uniref:nuclear transport factor 2 family protein n=1 Tax=Sphingosinicella sp. TaxID=1917971 RepID=UPI004037F655